MKKHCAGGVGGLVVLLAWGGGMARGASTFTIVADKTKTATGEAGPFTSFNLPSLSGNNLLFFADTSNNFGFFTATIGGGVTKLMDTDDTVGSHGLVEATGNRGGLSSTDAVVRIESFSDGLYRGSVGAVGFTKVLELPVTAPGETTSFKSFAEVKLSGNNVAFNAFFNSGFSQGVYSVHLDGTGLATITDTNAAAPGHGNFSSFTTPAVSGNNLVFSGGFGSNGGGIYSAVVGTSGIAKIVDTSDTAPGHGVFTGFDSAVSISGNHIAINGFFSGGSGIYAATPGTAGVTEIVQSGDVAPGGHGTFTGVQNVAINADGNVAFEGDFGGVNQGIYYEANGVIQLVIADGDPLFGSTVSFLTMDRSAYDGNQIAFAYGLQNGAAGIAVVQLPEPAAIGLLSLGWVGMCRRRWPAAQRGHKRMRIDRKSITPRSA